MAKNPEEGLRDLLRSNWTAANTDSMPALVLTSSEYKRISTSKQNRDIISIYERNRQNEKNSTGATTKRVISNMAIDCRSFYNKEHAERVLEEVERILDANITSAPTGYDILDPSGTYTRYNDGMNNKWRFVLECKLIDKNMARG